MIKFGKLYFHITSGWCTSSKGDHRGDFSKETISIPGRPIGRVKINPSGKPYRYRGVIYYADNSQPKKEEIEALLNYFFLEQKYWEIMFGSYCEVNKMPIDKIPYGHIKNIAHKKKWLGRIFVTDWHSVRSIIEYKKKKESSDQ